MQLRAIESGDDELVVEIGGENHTFMNVLKRTLLSIEAVDAAMYDMNPEQSGGQTDPILTIKTTDRDPLDALEEAAEQVQADAAAFREAYETAV